jgi:hypothetical protein
MKLLVQRPARSLPVTRWFIVLILVLLMVGGGLYMVRQRLSRSSDTALSPPTLSLTVRPHAMGDFLVLTVSGVGLSHHLRSLAWVGSPSFHQTARRAEFMGRSGNPDGHTTFEVVGQSVVLVYGPAWRHRTGYVALWLTNGPGKTRILRSSRLTL